MTTSPPMRDPRNPGRTRIPARDLLRLAVLNTRRHTARALANVAGIAVAVAALVFFLSFFRGTYEGIMFSAVIDYATAHFQVQSESFDEDDSDAWLSESSLLDASVGDPAAEAA